MGQWRAELRNVKLSADGLTTVSGLGSYPPELVEDGGLDVTQGPDGTLFVAGNGAGIQKIFYHKPLESVPAPGLKIKSVFPRRGPRSGGSKLTVFCENLSTSGGVSVKVGVNECLNPVVSGSKITCTIPSGAGMNDVVVTAGSVADSLSGGYRYTNGQPGVTPPPSPPAPTFPPPAPTPATPAPTPLPPTDPAPTVSGNDFGITGFEFVNADTDSDLGSVPCSGCLDGVSSVNIRAVVDPADFAGSVGFTLTSPSGSGLPSSRVENVPPYAMFGDNEADYAGFALPSGNYVIEATAYEGPSQTGVEGGSLTQAFSVSARRRALRRGGK